MSPSGPTPPPSVAPHPRRYLALLALTALGVVYGDIGTSPLYALRECFFGPHSVPPTPENVVGILSLVFWALVLVVSVKYVAFILRADNRGEGGILALMALLVPRTGDARRRRWIIVGLGLFGAALLYGDGMITPAISVLSAVEGLNVATPLFEPVIIPITIAVLVGLFLLQSRGTAGVGALFGPVMLLWFAVIALLGIGGIVRAPTVLGAVNPAHGVDFFMRNGWAGFLVLGAVVLVVTGCEALYADMGHFGPRPIRATWYTLVLPALLLNYFGQGALLLTDPGAAHNPFYRLAPQWALYPLVALATTAAVIASQAVISGAFSLTRQAVQLGYSPRLEIEHTSRVEIGQIYVPQVNWALMVATIGLVLGFGTSSRLAAAYGIAVTGTMATTSVLFYFLARERWHWRPVLVAVLCLVFFAIDLSLFGASAVKFWQGGWFPLAVAAGVFVLMTTWNRGRELLAEKLNVGGLPVEQFLGELPSDRVIRVPGTAVFLTSNAEGIPLALLHNLKHNKVLHQQVALLTITTDEVPHVPDHERLQVTPLGHGFWRLVARYGFMEDPNVPALLDKARGLGFEAKLLDTTFFLGQETVVPSRRHGMALWREKLFGFMSRNAHRATAFFRLPPNRVIEVGAQIEL
ncbi:MAG TPA: potassium transporter Kup [Gemmatimonadales bacterium]|jgi:KUP system potassium uptake protein|nr:potassium transporter Kup [Gemmatimonadales bacterium]